MIIQDQLPAKRVKSEWLRFFKAIGVDALSIYPPPPLKTFGEMVDYLAETKAFVGSHGLDLRTIALRCPDAITLGLADRDEAIEEWRCLLRAMGETGIPLLGYNFKPVTIFRTAPAEGRGGARYSTFSYEEFMKAVPHFPEKEIGEDRLWANLIYFLERILPAAEEAGVRMALHPDDPPIPEPLAGIARILSTLDQYRRLFARFPSKSNGMLFCQGCVAEMGVEVCRAIREFGALDRIVSVHFRNIKGRPRHFQEVFLDEGDVDMAAAMRAYRKAGFEGPFMMDHTPVIPDDRDDREGHAFAAGYIRALLHAVYRGEEGK